MKILVAGSNGFLGRIFCDVLKNRHQILTLSRQNANINIDLSKSITTLPYCDILVHCFGTAHFVPKNTSEDKSFFDVNVIGTKNLLKSIQHSTKPSSIVYISSVSVYGLNSGLNIDESFFTTPNTAYGESKLKAEKILLNWAKRNNVNLTILRLPLVIGPNSKGNLHSLIQAIKNGYYFRFSNNEILKSVVLAEDIANLIPLLIMKNGIYNLSDGKGIKISCIENYIANYFNKKINCVPYRLVKIVAFIGDIFSFIPLNSSKLNKLNSSLTFSSEKAQNDLNWLPKDIFETKWL